MLRNKRSEHEHELEEWLYSVILAGRGAVMELEAPWDDGQPWTDATTGESVPESVVKRLVRWASVVLVRVEVYRYEEGIPAEMEWVEYEDPSGLMKWAQG